MSHKTLDDVKLLALPRHLDPNGQLVAIERRSGLPFTVKRVFTVMARQGDIRGRHAHKKCGQVLLCPLGAVDVTCDDGRDTRTYRLDHSTFALLVPASIWATQLYRNSESVLVVLCDQPYDEDDYIRDYNRFRAWREDAVP